MNKQEVLNMDFFLTQLPRFRFRVSVNFCFVLFGIIKKFWSYYPRMKKCSIKIYSKKDYGCWLNFVENFFTTHDKSTNCLKDQKIYPRMIKSSIKIYSEDVKFSQKNIMLAG
jgi:hypothetical protein